MRHGKEDRGGGGLGMSVPRKKFRGWSLSIKDLKFQELIILTDVGGGGLSRMLSSIPYPNICGANFNDEEYVQTDCSEAIPVFLLKSRTVDMYYTYCTGVLLCFLFDCWQIN